jgi:hypothetical protein
VAVYRVRWRVHHWLSARSAMKYALGHPQLLRAPRHEPDGLQSGCCSPIGLLIVLYVMFGWWRDTVKRIPGEGHHTRVVSLHLRYGMLLFIASEVMFFVAWFWAYFDACAVHRRGYPVRPRLRQPVVHWPPEGIETFDPWHLPLLNTLILLCIRHHRHMGAPCSAAQ